jgi:hypothetical protein
VREQPRVVPWKEERKKGRKEDRMEGEGRMEGQGRMEGEGRKGKELRKEGR